MSIAQVIKNNECFEAIAVDPAAAVAGGGAKITWAGGEIDASVFGAGATFMMQPGAGIGWAVVNGVLVEPSAPPAPVPTGAELIAYAEAKRVAIAAGGISVNIASAGAAPQLVEVGTNTDGLAFLANAVQLTATAPGTSYDWDQAEPVTITGAQVLQIQAAVGLWQQQLFAQKTAIRNAVNSGTIASFAQIDDPTSVGLPAWPANS
jgi:hypothetical protein